MAAIRLENLVINRSQKHYKAESLARSFNSWKQDQARSYNQTIAINLKSKKKNDRQEADNKGVSAFAAHLVEANRVRKEREARMFREVLSKHDTCQNFNMTSKSSMMRSTDRSNFETEALNQIESRILKIKVKRKENLSTLIKRIASQNSNISEKQLKKQSLDALSHTSSI